jgi:two-component system, NtrC family, sensor kinase
MTVEPPLVVDPEARPRRAQAGDPSSAGPAAPEGAGTVSPPAAEAPGPAPASRRWRPPVRSLRVKLATAVILILVAAMGVVFLVQYRWFQRELIERLGLSSTPLSDVIKGSLTHAMQTRNLSELSAIVDNVSRQPGVIKVFIVDKTGEIKFSPNKAEIGTRVPLSDPTCQLCHRVQAEARAKTVIFPTAGGERVYRNVNPIANEPMCHGCHSPASKLNGVLISDFSMAETDRQLASTSRQMLLALLLAAGVTGLAITLIMNRLVVSKLERFAEATRALGRGRLDLRVRVGASGDEIGTLATSFNEMVESLRRATEVRERQELLESVLNHVDDSVVVLAPEGRVIAFNRGSERAFGLRAAEVVGRSPALLGDDHDAILGRARTVGSVAEEMRLRTGDGRYFPALVHVVPLRDEGDALLATVVIAQDLTEEKVKERLQAQLVQSEKLAAMGRLAAGVAHELNNPLGHVLLYAKLLLEDGLPEDGRRANARRIVDNVLRCKTIVRSLLDYAKQSDVQMGWTDLNAVVRDSVDLLTEELAGRRVACRLRLAPDLPAVRCDGRQIQQVLVNLIRNGAEAIGEDGAVTVFTALAAEPGAVVVGVQDDGPGIPEEALAKVFEPFYTTKEQGAGLGLAICYGLVERHRGRLWVESRQDPGARGSTFYVQLPVGA